MLPAQFKTFHLCYQSLLSDTGHKRFFSFLENEEVGTVTFN